MLRIAGKKLKVLYPIVGFIPIYVVNNFFRKQVPANVFFHHKSVFKHVRGMLSSMRVVWAINRAVAVFIKEHATFPVVVILGGFAVWKMPPFTFLFQEGCNVSAICPDCLSN